ncbi:MAG: protease complex subunit PrcB family protein [Candidatus Aenigmarchaeota archaeon]|nr:protease complex subunit PrcB family protein [Candidatus Aenigmarchaeota archaeon]
MNHVSIKQLVLLLPVLVLLVVGCTSTNVQSLVKSMPEVQKFLDENPGAEVRVVYWDNATTQINAQKLYDACGTNIAIQPYWYVLINNKGSTIETWVDEATNRPVCLYKAGQITGSQNIQPVTPTNPLQPTTSNPIPDEQTVEHPITVRYVSLNELFTLQKQETVIVSDYKNLRITYVTEDSCNANPVPATGEHPLRLVCPRLHVRVSLLPDSTMKYIQTQEEKISLGGFVDAFGARIALTGLTNGIATLKVTVPSDQTPVPLDLKVSLNQEFYLRRSQAAIVTDYNDMKIVYLSSTAPECSTLYPCPPRYENIALEVSLGRSPPCPQGIVCAQILSAPQTIHLKLGEKKSVFGADIAFLDFLNEKTGIPKLRVSHNDFNKPPVIVGLSGPTRLSVNQKGTWTVRAYDPEAGYISYGISFGDAVQGSTARSLSSTVINEATFEHTYSNAGTYRITVTVRDEQGLATTATMTIDVTTTDPTPGCAESLTITSDENTLINGERSVNTWSGHPSWSAVSAQLPQSKWIWESYTVKNATATTVVNFTRTFSIRNNATNIQAILQMSADNLYTVRVNDHLINQSTNVYNFLNVYTYDISQDITPGTNVLKFEITNLGGDWGTNETNPAGLIYEASVHYTCPTSSTDQERPFETLSKGASSGHDDKKEYVIKESSAWKNLWSIVQSGRSPTPLIPSVNFTDDMVIAVFQGNHPTGGYSIEITKIVEDESSVQIVIKETTPPPGSVLTTAFTQPYHIVKMKRTDKPVLFARQAIL